MKLAKYLSFGFLITTILLSPFAYAKEDIVTKTLPNGLRVIVLKEYRAPIAMQLLAYGVGSMDEPEGKTGLSHALEHMMFKGTQNAPANTFSLKIHEIGGLENAYTTYDYTAYHQLFSKQHLDMIMKYEADRMQNLQISDENFTQEIKVVRDERLRSEDDPYAMFYEQLQYRAFRDHTYKNPIIGWMPDLQNMTIQDIESWYQKWYAPNHAVLIIAGDVDPNEVFKLAEEYYGDYQADFSNQPVVNRTFTKPEKTELFDFTHPQAQLPAMAMTFLTPALHDVKNDHDVYALAILASVLDRDSASRLEKSLIRDSRIARSAWASYNYIKRGPALFVMGGAPSQGYSLEEMKKGLQQEVQKIIDDGVDPKELERIKIGLIASQQYLRDSLSTRVNQIARLTMTGLPPDALDDILDNLKKVTDQDIQRVAKKYLSTPVAVGYLLPQEATSQHFSE